MSATKVRLTWPARVLLAVFGLIVVALLWHQPNGSDQAPHVTPIPKVSHHATEQCYVSTQLTPQGFKPYTWCEHWVNGEWR